MIFLITFLMFILVGLGMAIGYILQKKTLRGSCGGLEQMGIERACDCESVCEEHSLYQIQEPGTGGLDQQSKG